MEHPERFDPRGAGGTLIDSEHRARYQFGAQVAVGKEVLDAACGVGYGIEILSRAGAASVTGVDRDPAAIQEAEARFGEYATALVEGDLGELPFPDSSFDVLLSFETIEHVQEPEKALAELRRVLRRDGVLVISSPNPDAYLGGNEHHIHEFRPEELLEAVGAKFENVAAFSQVAWLGSSISAPRDGDAAAEILRTAPEPSEPPYSIVVGSDGELPEVHGVLAVGDTFDVRWWSQQLDQSRAETMRAVEREKHAERKLIDTSETLLQANNELPQVPLLKHRLAALEERHNELADRHHQLLGSRSWRITAPLRRFRSKRS
jgi:ubiquinone/menaquinone biosynthesis C-methylase UbiE